MKPTKRSDLGAATRAVHAGEHLSPPARRPAAPPIYQTAPFIFDDTDDLVAAFEDPSHTAIYSRWSNPTVRVLEQKIAALEGAEDAVAFASGMAAIGAVLQAGLGPGDRLLAARELYGGTRTWVDRVAAGTSMVEVELHPAAEIEAAVAAGPAPRLVLVESPTNPTLSCIDLTTLAAVCRARNADLVESGVIVPALTSHRALSPDERIAVGISDGLVRLSVGIEDPDDLEADLAAALDGIAP